MNPNCINRNIPLKPGEKASIPLRNSRHGVWGMLVLVLLSIGLALFCVFALVVGRYPLTLHDIFALFSHPLTGSTTSASSINYLIIFKVRLPRICAAVLIGAALSGAGACYQNIFRNPMVEPSLLGVTAGAAFGAAVAILGSFDIALVQSIAFISGLVAVAVTMILSSIVKRHGDRSLTLILCGMVTGTLFSALLMLTKYVADPYTRLPAITYWLMGSLTSITINDLRFASYSIVAGLVLLTLLRWRINAMAFGEDEARSLGVNTGAVRAVAIVASTLMTAAAVSISGMIGWIGLVVPHCARMITGPSFTILFPVSTLLGAFFLLTVDTISRVVFTMEIPIGILTAVMGAPVFFVLLAHGKRGWQ